MFFRHLRRDGVKFDRFAVIKLCHPLKKRNGIVKCQINQIASLIKASILEATHREPARSAVAVHAGTAAAEAEAAGVGANNRTAPIVAVGPHMVERPRAAVAAARHGQFKRGGKSSRSVVSAPT